MMQNRRRFQNPYRPIVIDCLKRYDTMRKTGGDTTKHILDIIDKVLDRYRNSDDEVERMKYNVIEMMYLRKTHKSYGVADKLCIDNATVFRWANDVINEICVASGLMLKDAIKAHK